MKKAKRTITGTHFVEQRPNRKLTWAAPTNEVPKNRRHILRMSFGRDAGVRRQVSAEGIAQALRDGALADAVFFLDTCFLRAPLDERVWQALLSKQIAISKMVNEELESWLTSPGSDETLAEQVRSRIEDASDRIIRNFSWDDYKQHAYNYYISLLLLRKLKGKQWAIEFEQINGRLPTKEEFFPGFKQTDRTFGDRAARMAWKGFCDYEKDNYAADEQTVVMAVLHGLMTGRETMILTRDHDLMDQFYKLIFLIDTHYRSMLFASKYVADPEQYHTQQKQTVCEGYPDFFNDRFVGKNDIFINPNLPTETSWNSLLPAESQTVMVGCIWFGDGPSLLQVADMSFCADREMAEVLRTKVKTSGLSTEVCQGKNCHIWPSPELQKQLGPCVAIAEDKFVNYHPGIPPYRVLDMIHVMRSNEGFDTVNVK
ncbi:hypothetical protein [Schlesneria sp. T3-172]|uniref:hypothetical protein n=1 Tax=Schlesneria sphaerica TaxID=3373610 RepID=UPI0037CBD754